MIREVCQKHYNTYFIDTEQNFLTSGGLPRNELFIADRLHLNEEGYALWTEIIKKELNKVLVNY
jgi:lysophospholipase L1-like esterase